LVQKHFREFMTGFGGNYGRVLLGDDGEYYEFYKLPDLVGRAKRPGLPCKDICGQVSLRRIHLTCLHCRARRIWLGKLPNLFIVDLHFWTVRRGRRFAFLKDFWIKWLASVIELLAD
jgi:hypothetical protein